MLSQIGGTRLSRRPKSAHVRLNNASAKLTKKQGLPVAEFKRQQEKVLVSEKDCLVNRRRYGGNVQPGIRKCAGDIGLVCKADEQYSEQATRTSVKRTSTKVICPLEGYLR